MADTQTLRIPVSPEVAATVREEDATLAAIKATGEAIVNAAVAAGNARFVDAQQRRAVVMRAILRHCEADETASVVGVSGSGESTVLLVEIPITHEASA